MQSVKSRLYTSLILAVTFCFLFLESCSSQSEDRNKINFKDSIVVVHDSLKLMSSYLDKIKEADVKNFFFDHEDYLYINNQKVARMSVGDMINFLNVVQSITGLSDKDSYKFISLALFLKDNYISGCFRHHVFGIYLYGYKETLENNYEEQRYIMLLDENTKKIKGSYIESYQLIDRRGGMLLIAPSDVKIK